MTSAVIGAGSWGTALAIHLARLSSQVFLWGRDALQVLHMERQRENSRYLPGIIFPESLRATDDIALAMQKATNIIIGVPSHAFRETLIKLKPYVQTRHRFISITKGLDPVTHQLLHEVAEEILGATQCFAVLSGPSFAKEVAEGLPTAVTLACQNKKIADILIPVFHSQYFRVYYNSDRIGVQLGGAIKNVLALAVGIAEGLGCGANAQAALITRGLAEMLRLGMTLGGSQETLMGLSGVGDLILTCTNNQSRNRRYGFAIGQGKTHLQAQKDIGQVVEGIKTAKEIYQVAQDHSVEMPIAIQVYRILYEGCSPQQALDSLLSRKPTTE